MINIIVALTRDGAIGKNGDQLYYISSDLKRFKKLTTGNTVIMGRRTFEALPKGALPNRKNIVVSRNKDYVAPGALVCATPTEALEAANGDAYIIGGAQIYKEFLNFADRLYITEIETDRPDADTFFPAIDKEQWEITESSELFHDEKSDINFRYLTLSRKQNPTESSGK